MTPHLVICSAICRGGMANWSEVMPTLVLCCVSLYSHWLQVFVWLSRYTHIQFPYKTGWTCYHQNPWWWHWSQLFHVNKMGQEGSLCLKSTQTTVIFFTKWEPDLGSIVSIIVLIYYFLQRRRWQCETDTDTDEDDDLSLSSDGGRNRYWGVINNTSGAEPAQLPLTNKTLLLL